jgi:hypothetical protein
MRPGEAEDLSYPSFHLGLSLQAGAVAVDGGDGQTLVAFPILHAAVGG